LNKYGNTSTSSSNSKLLKSYYLKKNPFGSSYVSNTSKSQQSNTSKDSTLTAIKRDVNSLCASADTLLKEGSKSLFVKKDIVTTDAKTGVKTKKSDYDMEAITKAINSFVSDYNSTIDSSSKTSSASVHRYMQSMTNQTKSYSKKLEAVGITIDSDSKLVVDQAKLSKADIGSLKSLFNDKYSFAYNTDQKASQVAQTTTTAISSSTYSNSGLFNSYSNYSNYNNWYS
jgi:hypothetical protein